MSRNHDAYLGTNRNPEPEIQTAGRNVSTIEDFENEHRRGPLVWMLILLVIGAAAFVLEAFAG